MSGKDNQDSDRNSMHTPEPWRVERDDIHRRLVIICASTEHPSRTRGLPVAYVDGRGDRVAIDIGRAVACVNACAGIPTEVLELPRLQRPPTPLEALALKERDEANARLRVNVGELAKRLAAIPSEMWQEATDNNDEPTAWHAIAATLLEGP